MRYKVVECEGRRVKNRLEFPTLEKVADWMRSNSVKSCLVEDKRWWGYREFRVRNGRVCYTDVFWPSRV